MEVAKTKFKQKCPKHPDYRIEFVQIDNLDANEKYKNIFCCAACLDCTFQLSNYQLIQEIVKSGIDSILPKWPPLDDKKLIGQLIQVSKGNEDVKSIEQQIQQYFTDLKDQIYKQIDICQKKMIKCAQEIPQNKAQIINQYQELSKINELRSILSDNTTDIYEKERQARELIENRLKEKKTNNEQFTVLLNQHKQQQSIFNLGSALQIQESIMKSISMINLFEYYDIIPMQNSNNNHTKLDIQFIKSKYCNGDQCQEIIKNQYNQYEITVKKENNTLFGNLFFNTVQNVNLEEEKKYIFRLQIQFNKINDYCFIGLMQNANVNNQAGHRDNLFSQLQQYENQQISLCQYTFHDRNCISQQMKGDKFELSKENEIEMRVCIKDQILEILDFPNYHYKLGLNNDYKCNLINHKDLRLYIGMGYLDNKIILKEAFTVEQFI